VITILNLPIITFLIIIADLTCVISAERFMKKEVEKDKNSIIDMDIKITNYQIIDNRGEPVKYKINDVKNLVITKNYYFLILSHGMLPIKKNKFITGSNADFKFFLKQKGLYNLKFRGKKNEL